MPRSKGGVNYTLAEQRLLLHVVREELPHRREQWQQVSNRYNEARDKTTVARDADSLWRKFKGMCRAAEDRCAPPNVKLAKEIKALIDGHAEFPGEDGSIAESDVNGPDDVSIDDPQEPNPENAMFPQNNMVQTNTNVSSITPAADMVGSVEQIREMLAPSPPARTKRQRVRSLQTSVETPPNQSAITDLAQLWAMMREENAIRDRREERRLQEWQEERRIEREEAATRHREMMSLIVQLFNKHESADTSNSK